METKMSPNTKSVLTAAALIVALLGFIAYLLRSSTPAAAPALPPTSGHLEEPAPGQPRVVRGDPKDPKVLRTIYAKRLQRLFARKGQTIKVQARGPGYTSFSMEFPADKPDLKHIEQLKQANPFFAELRNKGFRALVLSIGPRVVWTKEL
jgi:hypothetical protein